MPETVRALHDLLTDLRASSSAGRVALTRLPLDEPALVALDRVAAHAVAALLRFVDEPAALTPAQRALSLVGGRRDEGQLDLSHALLAMRDLDDGRHGLGRGLSRLLESALDANGRVSVPRLSHADVDDDLAPLARALEEHGAILSAVDDLAHALSLPSDLAAGVVLAECVLHLTQDDDDDDGVPALDVGLAWLRHRGAKGALLRLFVMRHAVDHIDDEDVALAVEHGVARALALWLVAERAVRSDALVHGDRAALTALIERAGLAPLEVLDAADLLRRQSRRR